MDLTLNNQQRFICHKTKPSHTMLYYSTSVTMICAKLDPEDRCQTMHSLVNNRRENERSICKKTHRSLGDRRK